MQRFFALIVLPFCTAAPLAAQARGGGVSGARELYEAYGAALREHRREALAGFYHRDGALVVFNGERIPQTNAQLDSHYRGSWRGPAFFAWDSLQFTPMPANQVLVTGGFRWLAPQQADTARFIYLAILERTSQGLRIRAEHETERPRARTGPAAAREAIIATSREFSARYERGDAAGMVALYTADGVILPPGRAASSGPEALTSYWTLAPGVRVLEHRATPDSIVIVGPVAYDWGTYRVRTQDSSAVVRETHGKYVIVWREMRPGTWRMHVDMWNSAPAPPPR